MELFVQFFVEFLRGMFDSVSGMTAIFYIDRELQNQSLRSHSPPSRSVTPLRRRRSRVVSVENTAEPAFKETSWLGRLIMLTIISRKTSFKGKLFMNILLNGAVFLVSALVITKFISPFISNSGYVKDLLGTWFLIMPYIVTLIFNYLWLLPIYIMSRLINCLWFQDIADFAFAYTREKKVSLGSPSTYVADFCLSLFIEVLFLLQSVIVNYLPLGNIKELISSIITCFLYALYAFEYKWTYIGWPLHKRLSFIEDNWPYFFGFGLPLTIFTNLLSDIWYIRGSMFSLLFPLFIVSAQVAKPVSQRHCTSIPLFAPVIAVSNFILCKIFKRSSRKDKITNVRSSQSRVLAR